jgi:hypothetical protein
MKRIVTVVATLALFVMLALSAPTAHAAARTASAAQASQHASTNAVPTNWCSGSTYWSYEGFGQRDVTEAAQDSIGQSHGVFTWTVRYDLFELRSESTDAYCGEFETDVHVLTPYPRGGGPGGPNIFFALKCWEQDGNRYTGVGSVGYELVDATTYEWMDPCTTPSLSANPGDSVAVIGYQLHSVDQYYGNYLMDIAQTSWGFTINA